MRDGNDAINAYNDQRAVELRQAIRRPDNPNVAQDQLALRNVEAIPRREVPNPAIAEEDLEEFDSADLDVHVPSERNNVLVNDMPPNVVS